MLNIHNIKPNHQTIDENKENSHSHEENSRDILDELNLTKLQKDILIYRYFRLLNENKGILSNITLLYNICKILIPGLSLVLSIIISINKSDITIVYWINLSISFLLSFISTLYSIFAIEKKYVIYSNLIYKLEDEWWKFVSLSDKYSEDTNKHIHEEYFNKFCDEIEKIYIAFISNKTELYNKNKISSYELKNKQ